MPACGFKIQVVLFLSSWCKLQMLEKRKVQTGLWISNHWRVWQPEKFQYIKNPTAEFSRGLSREKNAKTTNKRTAKRGWFQPRVFSTAPFSGRGYIRKYQPPFQPCLNAAACSRIAAAHRNVWRLPFPKVFCRCYKSDATTTIITNV
jgi:hypothetical protein